ncbi:MAG: helix-turn-helix transcriptional regulator [Pseudomonadota bacterium]
MIRNERQYKITKAQLEDFDRKLQTLSTAAVPGVHPRIVIAQRDAIQSQVEDLREELRAYEGLQTAGTKVLELTSLEQIPVALIQARIAAGLTQRELAMRLGMKEQQLQRYEATNYAGASLDRIMSIFTALGVRVREDVFLPGTDVSLARVLSRAQSAGLSKTLVKKRIVPSGGAEGADESDALGTASLLNRIFGWTPAVLFGEAPLFAGGAALAGARFKLPQSSSSRTTEAYATYAHYVAGLLLRATPTLPSRTIPTDARTVREALLTSGGDLDFATVLSYVWNLGVAVLPLADTGAFHGATWRIDGRNVIVLKQGARLESRWAHDALHELRHAGEEAEDKDLSFIDYEKLSKENAHSAAEQTAAMFAGDVMLDGRAEALVEICANEAGNSVERLKTVVPRVAEREGVSVAALANYMAFRLSLQGVSWWGAATNLQAGGVDPWQTTRDQALSHLDLTSLDDAERGVLLRALEGDSA